MKRPIRVLAVLVLALAGLAVLLSWAPGVSKAPPSNQEKLLVAGAGLWRLLGVYYDAVPDKGNQLQQSRAMHHHFVSLDREYLPKEAGSEEELYAAWSKKLGRPALVPSYENEVDPARLIGLRGPYCAYLSRTIVSPDDRKVAVTVGNNDGYRLYLNEELLAERDEQVWWTPRNDTYKAALRAGPNRLLVKLLKRGDELRFTLGLKELKEQRGLHAQDWLVDLADLVPPLHDR